MGFIETISKDTSNKLGNRLNKTEEEKAVLNYGLFMIIHTSLAIILTFIVGLITNMVMEIMIITFVAALMKRYSGGVHANTPNRCLIIGIIISFTLARLDKLIINTLDDYLMFIILSISIIISYIILYMKCPIGTKNKPLKKESTRKKLRKKAFNLLNFYSIIIFIGYILYITKDIYTVKIIISCICLGVILQISVLTKFGENIIMGLDYILEKLKIS